MKTYIYHVSYFRKSKKGEETVGDCTYYTKNPITNGEEIKRLRQTIEQTFEGEGHTVVILNFTLLGTEDTQE